MKTLGRASVGARLRLSSSTPAWFRAPLCAGTSKPKAWPWEMTDGPRGGFVRVRDRTERASPTPPLN